MTVRRFDIGDRVTWNSEAGRVSGRIVRIHEADFPFKGYRHHASSEDPQYEIVSDRTDHVAAHRGGALQLFAEHGEREGRRPSRQERVSSMRPDDHDEDGVGMDH
ncbi:hypothetical protein HNR16_000412 [Pseudoclavibacter chungangensis]|nr:hypothetical protein [Pseudoclavibacter chungangensis]